MSHTHPASHRTTPMNEVSSRFLPSYCRLQKAKPIHVCDLAVSMPQTQRVVPPCSLLSSSDYVESFMDYFRVLVWFAVGLVLANTIYVHLTEYLDIKSYDLLRSSDYYQTVWNAFIDKVWSSPPR